VKKTAETNPEPEEIAKPGFLSFLGLDQKFKKSGINVNSLTKGLLGIAGPFILSSLFRGGGNRGNAAVNPFSTAGSRGGLNSMISLLSGGRGFSRTGNLFNRVFGF